VILTPNQLRSVLKGTIKTLDSTGHDVSGMIDRLDALPDGHDALFTFAQELAERPLRADWAYHEPHDEAGFVAACDAARRTESTPISIEDAQTRVRAGWAGSVVGCQLGKRFEINPSLAELRTALESTGEWPLNDYVSDAALIALGRRHPHGPMRGYHGPAFADDDQNYTVLGMLNLERHGRSFTHDQLRRLWGEQLPILMTFGPERRDLALIAAEAVAGADDPPHPLRDLLVMGDLWCGAQIRADAYGYACPGDPEQAARLAFRDATLNHRGTGAFATAWTAATMAAIVTVERPLDAFRIANRHIPQQSRFAVAMRRAIGIVENASDWQAGYDDLHAVFGEFDHCRVVQESATLMNTLHFATSVGEGVCIQVMQGNDTDSYGATAGALLGLWFGPGHLEERWLSAFDNRVRIGLAQFDEDEIDVIGDRLAALSQVDAAAA
jgi:ADP-ribosylglycohydrolase